MSKKWLAAAALLIICCCAAYQLLRETPTRPNGAGDIPRIENPAPIGGKMGAGDAGSENRRGIAAESAAPGLENTISGRVITTGNGNPAEARTALPVSGAAISLLSNPRVTTTTDDNGAFTARPTEVEGAWATTSVHHFSQAFVGTACAECCRQAAEGLDLLRDHRDDLALRHVAEGRQRETQDPAVEVKAQAAQHPLSG